METVKTALINFLNNEKTHWFRFSISVLCTLVFLGALIFSKIQTVDHFTGRFVELVQFNPVFAGALVLTLVFFWTQFYVSIVLRRDFFEFCTNGFVELLLFYNENNPMRNKIIVETFIFFVYLWIGTTWGFDRAMFIILFNIWVAVK